MNYVTRKKLLVMLISLLIVSAVPQMVMAHPAAAAVITDQLTLEDLAALNNGEEQVFIHDGRVTFIAGKCTEKVITNSDEAASVVLSMLDLLGGNERTQFIPWRTLTDANGSTYYVFQQMYAGTSVLGGAVKVITNAAGEMTALSSSIVSELPEEEAAEGILAEEAEQIVLRHAEEAGSPELRLIPDLTDKMILPMVLSVDDEYEAEDCRFVWVVYTDNPTARPGVSDLPYLAHYVDMDGTYLYSLETIIPGDIAGATGFDTAYIFEFMEPAEYTGYVDLSDGTEMELTVTVMRDKRTGMYYLGNIERGIVVADCWEFLYNGGRVVLEYSPDNLEWDQVGLLTLYNYCRAWDYYSEIGWIGADGQGTPMLILNNAVDEKHSQINNAFFVGNYMGWSIFGASRANDYSQCLDVLAHEFTHCVTGAVMTYNSYQNDFGAINEAMSDIQGKICQMMMEGKESVTWNLGDKGLTPVRSMSEPHRFQQPEFVWDLYYLPAVKTPTAVNDRGGVHSNSSLLNNIAYRLIEDGGMSLEEARAFWFAVDCTMVPGTDYVQLGELLPQVMKAQGMETFLPALEEAINATRIGQTELPEEIDSSRALLTLTLPDNENFTDGNWGMQIISIDVDAIMNRVHEIFSNISEGDYSDLPESVRKEVESEQQKHEPVSDENLSFSEKLTRFFETLDAKIHPTPTPTPDPTVAAAQKKEISEWVYGEMHDKVFAVTGSAGQDGLTIRLMARPGRVIPILFHMSVNDSSNDPDQMVFAFYLLDRWVALPIPAGEDELTDEKINEILESAFFEELFDDLLERLPNIRSLNDVLDMITVTVHGGDTYEITSRGLETIVLPEPGSTIGDALALEEIPGRKSRPKLPEDL